MRSTTAGDWVTLAALGILGYVVVANWGSLSTIGSGLNSKVSGALNSVASAVSDASRE